MKIKYFQKKCQLRISIILLALFTSCINCEPLYNYRSPEFTGDGLIVGTLEEVGIDSKKMGKAVDCIYANRYDQIHSMLIYKDGMLVFEEYFEGNKFQWDDPDFRGARIQWHKDSMHVIMSCTKSITSACVGIALDKGYIESVNESIFNYLPAHQHFNTNGKRQITIEHLLTMTSGLEWDEWRAHGNSDNDIDAIYFDCQTDPVACILNKQLKHKPGDKFTYNGGGMIILGEIVKNATKMNIEDFSNRYLFEPLEIDSVYWYQFDNGTYAADGSIRMTPRDMLKFGVMYLNDGKWNNQRVLPRSWVERSEISYRNNNDINIPIDDSGRNGYAYSWWTNEISGWGKTASLFQAGGWGGQEIIVIPEENMVVVFTGGNYEVKKHLYEILERFVLPSIQ